MKKTIAFLFSIASGLLFSLAWPYTGGISPLIFFAWVPFLFTENYIYEKSYRPGKVLLLGYVMFLVFNLFTTWWIYLASPAGAALAVLVNSFLMAVPAWLFHVTKRRVGVKEGYIGLVVYWLAFEYLHYIWELSWPWLSLGNVFANNVSWIQWYEFSGVSGGTCWILLVNILVFFTLKKYISSQYKFKAIGKHVAGLVLLLLIPVVTSLVIYNSCADKGRGVSVAMVQPNIDPYSDKFNNLNANEQLHIFLKLAASCVDENTDFLLGPETALPYSISENNLEQQEEIIKLRSFLNDFPKLRLITGMSSHRFFKSTDELSPVAKELEPGIFYESYNSSIQLSNNRPAIIYHKMQLVLGVEKVPFSSVFPFLEKLALNLGGTSGSLGVQNYPMNFTSELNPDIVVTPFICYESIYGNFITEFIRKGANLIFIITNDGWWGSTPGYKQHMAYARLRAIENRRSIARCANTGISCFINQRGDIIEQTAWWQAVAIKQTLRANNEMTFYSKNGDIIGRSSLFIALLLLIYTISRWLMGKKTSTKEE